MKILTDRFIFTKNQQRDMLREHRVCGYIDAYFPIAFHSKYINVILLPDIKLADRFSHSLLRDFHFKDGM